MNDPVERPQMRHGVTVYRLYDIDGTLLYVGKGHVFDRMYNHRLSTQWFKQVVRAEFDHFDTRELAAIAEAAQIRDLNPKCNKQRIHQILIQAQTEDKIINKENQQ